MAGRESQTQHLDGKSQTPKLVPTTIGNAMKDAVKEAGKDPKKMQEVLDKVTDKEKLKTRIVTAEKVAEFKNEMRNALLGDNLSDAYIGRLIDVTIQRQKAEQALNNLKNLKETLDGVEKVEDLRKLDAKTLIKLEDTYEGIMLFAFTDMASKNDKVDFTHWNGYKKPSPGTRLTVNFLGCAAGEKEIGAADLLPPSVRRITVYKNGDLNDSRTSERRVGLKGQNKSGNGFYDGNGYIPVLSNDVIEIGGKERSEKDTGVEASFDAEFRKKADGKIGALDEEAYKKYTESEHGKKDQEYLQELFRRNPNAQRRKQMSLEEIQALKEKIDGDGVGSRIAKLALEEASKPENEKYMPKHCWDAINNLYRSAGVTSRTRIYQDLNYEGKDCGDHHASPEMLAMLAPGDWVYYNNKNTADSHGNHSALIIDYDKETNMATVASGSYGHPLRIHSKKVNFNEMPVTHITKPGAIARPPESQFVDTQEIRIDVSRSVAEQVMGLSSFQREMANIIEEEFLAAGLPRSIAAAAIVNAKAESGLNPGAVGDGGHSIGLFQLNDWGAGKNMSVEERKDPRVNAKKIIKVVLGGFGNALRERAAAGASISELAAIFSRDIERPRDKFGAMNRRARMTAQLFKSGSESQAA